MVDTTTPLLSSVNETAPDPTDEKKYGALAKLYGTWNSPPTAPTGYNVMPVPAGNVQNQSDPALNDWQSKNFYYFEEMTFTAPGEAPNRGQEFQQGCYGLTYEQRVYFAPDQSGALGGLSAQPAVPASTQNTLVHYENGLWLNLHYEAQPENAYAPPTLPAPTATQPANYQICKQVSVPHGNSMLATGTITSYDKPPVFPANVANGKPFNIPSANVKNPLEVLTAQLAALEKDGVTVTNTTEIHVSTMNPGGGTSNLLFEQGNADVTAYDMYLYIEELSNNTTQLQYLQTITMRFDITTDPKDQAIQPGGPNTTFLHIDANTLVPVPAT